MKASKAQTHSKARRSLRIAYDAGQRLTSYAGLVLFGPLLGGLDRRLKESGFGSGSHRIFGLPKLLLVLVVHVLLGFRRLRGVEFYGGDPLVARAVGLKKLPSVSTLSRGLKAVGAVDVDKARRVLCDLATEQLARRQLRRVTVDFDGTTQLTSGVIEGTAVGFNKTRAGSRGYYPLFATVAQTSQFLDFLHRPGNAHDSNGATWFMSVCFGHVRRRLPGVRLDTRVDSAFFDQSRLEMLDAMGVEFTCSVPFERMPRLKKLVETQRRWRRIDDDWSFAEVDFRPTTWKRATKFRFILVRRATYKKRKGIVPEPLQLDLFTPVSPDYRYKVIVTNKREFAGEIIEFHNGRGGQERLFGEAKQHAALDVIATRRRLGNELFTVASMLGHNLARTLQIESAPAPASTTAARPLWRFVELGTLQLCHLHVAGRLTRPAGAATLTIGAAGARRRDFDRYRQASA